MDGYGWYMVKLLMFQKSDRSQGKGCIYTHRIHVWAHLAIFGFLILSVSAWMVCFFLNPKVPEKKIFEKNTSPPCHPQGVWTSSVRCSLRRRGDRLHGRFGAAPGNATIGCPWWIHGDWNIELYSWMVDLYGKCIQLIPVPWMVEVDVGCGYFFFPPL